MNKVIVITGPTAVGKTKLSIELAKRYNGEIINADAVQVYKGLDIGSAKVTEEEKEGIPHHLFDIKEVDEEYRATLINFAKYKLVMFAMAKLMEMKTTEQNKVALYLFNHIKI